MEGQRLAMVRALMKGQSHLLERGFLWGAKLGGERLEAQKRARQVQRRVQQICDVAASVVTRLGQGLQHSSLQHNVRD